MSDGYLYACAAHGKKYGVIRLMEEIEHIRGKTEEEKKRISELHLDSCQVKGCQFKRSCVIAAALMVIPPKELVEVAAAKGWTAAPQPDNPHSTGLNPVRNNSYDN